MVSYVCTCGDEYYRVKKRVTVDKRLSGMEYAQAGIIYEPACEFLVSYETIVAELAADGWLTVYALFSATTRKHLSRWGRLHGVDYYTLKRLYEQEKSLNIYTGEKRDIPALMIRTIGQRL